MLKNLRNKKKKGFTLIELIIVIAIIAILAAVAVPQFGKIRENANAKTDIANAKTIANAVSTLLAEEKITLSDSNIVGTNITITSSATTDTPAGIIKQYLQTAPTGKLKAQKGKNFIVNIDANGGVKVYLGSVSSGTLVYPDASGDYKIN